jgi:hypothetical protein
MGKFKAGDWVIGWHANYMDRNTKPWQIAKIEITDEKEHAIPEGYPEHATYTKNLVHAHGEEYPIF